MANDGMRANDATGDEGYSQRIQLGQNIRNRLQRIGKTNSWLAEKIQVQPSTTSRLINGEVKQFSWDLITRISDVLMVPISDLLEESSGIKVFTGIKAIDDIIEPINFNLFQGAKNAYENIGMYFSQDYRLNYIDDPKTEPIDLYTELKENEKNIKLKKVVIMKANLFQGNQIMLVIRNQHFLPDSSSEVLLPSSEFTTNYRSFEILDIWRLSCPYDDIRNGSKFTIDERWISAIRIVTNSVVQ